MLRLIVEGRANPSSEIVILKVVLLVLLVMFWRFMLDSAVVDLGRVDDCFGPGDKSIGIIAVDAIPPLQPIELRKPSAIDDNIFFARNEWNPIQSEVHGMIKTAKHINDEQRDDHGCYHHP